MPLNTIDGLTNEIVAWSNYGISTATASGMVTLAEDRIYRELRVREMEAQTSVTITSGVIPVPGDLIEVKDARINASPQQALQRKTTDWIYNKYPDRSGSGIPKYFAREGSNFIFGPYPSGGYTVVLNYYSKPATVVSGTLTGILLSSPGLLLNAALVETTDYLMMPEMSMRFEQKYQQLKDLVVKQDKNARFSGSPLAVTPA